MIRASEHDGLFFTTVSAGDKFKLLGMLDSGAMATSMHANMVVSTLTRDVGSVQDHGIMC